MVILLEVIEDEVNLLVEVVQLLLHHPHVIAEVRVRFLPVTVAWYGIRTPHIANIWIKTLEFKITGK